MCQSSRDKDYNDAWGRQGEARANLGLQEIPNGSVKFREGWCVFRRTVKE